MRRDHQQAALGHLSRYLHEFDFQNNTRKFSDTERAAEAVRGGVGKRLTYRSAS